MSRPDPRLRPVEDNTLRAQVARQILGMVAGGHYQPGEKLTEQALSDQLQVSRAPLREAIRELVDQGILISRPYRGLRVRPVSSRDLEELYSMRTALEQFAFRLSWSRRDAAALADLRRRYDALIAVQTSGDRARTIECELTFHSWVYELSGHALLLSHWQRLIPLVQIYMSLHHRTHGSHGQFRHMTTEYLQRACDDDLPAMLDHIAEHMKQGLSSVLAALDGAGGTTG
ncbi:MAG: GntR family transcriptional regulator [Alphaproteobacteria bacterium]|nr:MAG: GntR family transcriptional regulator [Alphaproteobacteria bacterium]